MAKKKRSSLKNTQKKFAGKNENSINKGSAYGDLKAGKLLLHTSGDYNRNPIEVGKARNAAKKRAEDFGGLFD